MPDSATIPPEDASSGLPSDLPADIDAQKNELARMTVEAFLDGASATGSDGHRLRRMREAFYRYCAFSETFSELPFSLRDIAYWEQTQTMPESMVARLKALFPPVPDHVSDMLTDWRLRDLGHRREPQPPEGSPSPKRMAREDDNPYGAFLSDDDYGSDHEALEGDARRYLIGGVLGRTFIDAIPARDCAEMLNRYHVSGVRGGAGSRASSDVSQRLFTAREVRNATSVTEVYNFEKELKVIRPESLVEIGKLAARFPNMRPVVDWLIDTLSLNLMTPYPYVNWPPILLNGPPGVGKTAFVRALGQTLDLHAEFMDCSMLQAPFELFGAHPTWGGATEGRITGAMARSEDANLIFMLDEFDKTTGGGAQPVQPAFTTVLEPTTADAVKDGFLNMAFDMSYVNWICTSNETDPINQFLLSRLKVFDIEAPSDEQMPAVIRSVWTDLRDANLAAWGRSFAPTLDERFITVFMKAKASPRSIRKMLQHTCARQARALFANGGMPGGEMELDPNNLLIDGNEGLSKRRGVGFMS